MGIKSYPDFIISKIIPAEGKALRDVHHDILGSPAYIEDLEVGYRGLIMFKPEYDDSFHRLHTSRIKSIDFDKVTCSEVTVCTENTVYILSRINHDETTFRGVPSFTSVDAENVVRSYINKQSNKSNKSEDQILQLASMLHGDVKAFGLMPSKIEKEIEGLYYLV